VDAEELKAYEAFRTGLTFQDVYEMIWSYSDDPRDWPKAPAVPKLKRDGKKTAGRRHTVLGKWREIKLAMWEDHKRQMNRYYPTADEEVPF
jgi:hypothetical protein